MSNLKSRLANLENRLTPGEAVPTIIRIDATATDEAARRIMAENPGAMIIRRVNSVPEHATKRPE